MFLFMLLACGNKQVPESFTKVAERSVFVPELEPIEFARARNEVALLAALERFQIGNQFVDVQVITGIADAPDGGAGGWRSCAGFDPWLMIDLKPEDHMVLFSNHLKPCKEDPDGYVVAFVAAVPVRGMDEPRPMNFRGESIWITAIDTRTVRVEWLVLFNEPLLP